MVFIYTELMLVCVTQLSCSLHDSETWTAIM